MTSTHASPAVDRLQRAAAPTLIRGTHRAGILPDPSGELIESVQGGIAANASQLGTGVIAYTKTNPLIALLLAVGAGALIVRAAKSRR